MELPQKACSCCKLRKSLTEFNRDRSRRDGLSYWCRACAAAKNSYSRSAVKERSRRWREKNPNYHRDRRYNLGRGRFEEMLAAQGGVCAICGTDEPGGRGAFHVDHDHACCDGPRSCGDCVRGLLCTLCNMGLERFKDNPSLLQAAARYLEDGTELLRHAGYGEPIDTHADLADTGIN